MATKQQTAPKGPPSGFLFGPPAPVLAFWHGKTFIGEVRGHPADIESARVALARKMARQQPTGDVQQLIARVREAGVLLYCGATYKPLTHSFND